MNNKPFLNYDENYESIIDYFIKEEKFVLSTQKETISQDRTINGKKIRYSKHFLGEVTNFDKKVCRFCGRNSNESGFKFGSNPHAIPNLIGNTVLFSNYECNKCNKHFGKSEVHFANYIGVMNRILSGVKGRNGLPVFVSNDKKIRIEYDEAKDLTSIYCVVDYDNDKRVNWSNAHELILTLDRDPYIPIEVYKTLLKIFLTLLPEEELIENNMHLFYQAIDFIQEENKDYISPFNKYSESANNTYPKNSSIYYEEDLLSALKSKKKPIRARILKRKSDNCLVPYMIFTLEFKHMFFQIIPDNPKNKKDVKVTLLKENPKSNWKSFSSRSLIKGRKLIFVFENRGEIVRESINNEHIISDKMNNIKTIEALKANYSD